MKMKRWIALIVLVGTVLFQGVALAFEVVEGEVKTVNVSDKTIEISDVGSSKKVYYDAQTRWPEPGMDPSKLLGKEVKIILPRPGDPALLVEES